MTLLGTPPERESMETALRAMSAEFVFLLDSFGIPTDIQAKLAILGYTDAVVFAKMEDSAPAMRASIKTDVGLDPDASAAARAMVARLVTAWEAAGTRAQRRRQEEAEQRVGDLPRTLPKGQHLDLARAFAKVHFEMGDRDRPAEAYVEWRLEQLEDGELQAETLRQVASKAETTEEAWGGCKIATDGTIKLRKARSEASLPANPEELRSKMRLMAHHWEMVRLKFPAKEFFAGLTMDLWSQYVNWLLGEDVYDNVVKDTVGNIVYRPSWHILLEYELQVRKRAFHQVNNAGVTIAQALKDAMMHQPTSIKYFTTPVSLAAGAAAAGSKRSHGSPHEVADGTAHDEAFRRWLSEGGHTPLDSPVAWAATRPAVGMAADAAASAQGEGQGWWDNKYSDKNKKYKKGDKKGSRSSGGSWRAGESAKTPDGRAKCFKYQRGACTGACDRAHVCLVCGGQHPANQCPRRPAASSTAAKDAALGGDAAGRRANVL